MMRYDNKCYFFLILQLDNFKYLLDYAKWKRRVCDMVL